MALGPKDIEAPIGPGTLPADPLNQAIPAATRGGAATAFRRDDRLPGTAQLQAPATCLVATLRRLKTLVVAIERIKAASAGSS